ncbi:MAG: metal ABC transporter substrate-binding protein [Dehalococcoidales bacterium]
MYRRKRTFLITAILVLSFAFASLPGGCAAEDTAKLKVVTSTSLLTYIVERVGGDRVDVVNIVPPAQHPGDFDAKPHDIQKLADADLFLLHGWPGETFAEQLIASANNPDLTVVRIDIKGNWMTPPVQLEATNKVAAALSQVDSKNSSAYQKSAAEYKNTIMAKEAEIKAKLAEVNLSEVNVLSAFWQAGFLKWIGLNVVGTYGDPDSLTPKVVKDLVDKGREAKVTLIIDNLHSGKDAGAGIAEELGCQRVILSNFPGGLENTETWEKAIDKNVELLLEAIAQ